MQMQKENEGRGGAFISLALDPCQIKRQQSIFATRLEGINLKGIRRLFNVSLRCGHLKK
jgi:hypothetical protein